MKSGKQRRKELKEKQQERAAKVAAARKAERLAVAEREGVAVNASNLAPYNSYGEPKFVERGYYEAIDFQC